MTGAIIYFPRTFTFQTKKPHIYYWIACKINSFTTTMLEDSHIRPFSRNNNSHIRPNVEQETPAGFVAEISS